jgi:hypothetical protein
LALRVGTDVLVMAEKKAFLLRLDSNIWDATERLARSELRSVNAQIEFLLRDALAQRGIRLKGTPARAPSSATPSPSSFRGSRVD